MRPIAYLITWLVIGVILWVGLFAVIVSMLASA
jgi:hypothetical protein